MKQFCRFDLAWTTFVLICALSSQAHPQSAAEDLLRSQQNWQVDCHPQGCMASVDILRGASGDPPNPQDTTQYVSLAVGVDRANLKPSLVMFEIDPAADKQAGIDLHFAHSVADGPGWKLIDDPKSPIHLPLNHCTANTCDAVIGGGTPDEATLKSCADLIAKMQSESHLFLSYTRKGHIYSTAISLTLFKQAYALLLTQTSAKPDATTKP